MEIGSTRQDISSPTHLSDNSWPHDGREDKFTQNILHPIDFSCFNIHYPRFSWRKIHQDKIYPLRPTFRTTLGRMVGRRVGPYKVNPIQSIVLVSIYVILGFHGDRSNRTYVLSDLLSVCYWPYCGPEGGPTTDIPHSIDFTCFNIRYSLFSWRKVQQDKIYSVLPTSRTTRHPMVGRRVGPPKIYPI